MAEIAASTSLPTGFLLETASRSKVYARSCGQALCLRSVFMGRQSAGLRLNAQSVQSKNIQSQKQLICSVTQSQTQAAEPALVITPEGKGVFCVADDLKQNPVSLQAKPCVSKASSGWQAGSTKFTEESCKLSDVCRRGVLLLPISFLSAYIFNGATERAASATEFADMPALRGKDYGKSKMRYPDYLETDSGLQYKDLRIGMGSMPKPGETVVVDWDGYTIGYYGRIFEARNKAKGGSFEGNEKDYLKIKLGNNENNCAT